ncbi:MAG: class I SAM-dependent methyltransferase [Hyphomicrobium sp.]|nr:class I SAM-dependent methyltransferase [Hyphomicrobium sp.]
MHTSPETRARRTPTISEWQDRRIDERAVKVAYRRWAPVYDHTFGAVSTAARKHAVEVINREHEGNVLEVGVGTGLSLPGYKKDLQIVGIDLSAEMLVKARQRAEEHGLANVAGLHEMEASNLKFPDESFDTVVAMFVMTVVPEPERVMQELSRVTRKGGEVLLVNHFSQEEGVRGWVERRMAPLAEIIGWRPVFDVARVMGCPELTLVEERPMRPWGLFTLMRFKKS